MIRQDIGRNRGLCLLDPHGSLADNIEQWCAQWGMNRRIHIIRPGDPSFAPGFNPLRIVPGEAISVRVDAMLAAFAQAWGVRDMSETPRLQKILRALFYVLAVKNLTLAESLSLLRANDPEGVRRQLTSVLPDPTFEITWGELNNMPRREFAEHVESTISRLSPFLSSEALKLVIGQRDHAIDFRAAMKQSEIVLVNLGARQAFSYDNARLFGTLLINDLFLTALGRTEQEGRQRPFSLYIDEAYDFLSGDVEHILDQTRKFGLHAVLAHQRIGQLKAKGEGIYSAVMNISNKIVLGTVSDEDAAILAPEILRGDIDLRKPKHVVTMPVVVDDAPFWLESESWSESDTRSRATSESYSITESSGLSESTTETFSALEGEQPERHGLATTAGASSAISTTTGYATSEGEAHSTGHTKGRSQTLRAVREERLTAIQYYTLEESMHLAQLKLRNLPDQYAIVKRRGERTVQVKAVDIEPMLSLPATLGRFRGRVAATSPYVVTVEASRAEIAARAASLIEPPAVELGTDEFWHEESTRKKA
jgi:hypothetical protein